MVGEEDRAYFDRVATVLRRLDVGTAPADLDAAVAALEELWEMAAQCGHALPDAVAQAEESESHKRLYERFRAFAAKAR